MKKVKRKSSCFHLYDLRSWKRPRAPAHSLAARTAPALDPAPSRRTRHRGDMGRPPHHTVPWHCQRFGDGSHSRAHAGTQGRGNGTTRLGSSSPGSGEFTSVGSRCRVGSTTAGLGHASLVSTSIGLGPRRRTRGCHPRPPGPPWLLFLLLSGRGIFLSPDVSREAKTPFSGTAENEENLNCPITLSITPPKARLQAQPRRPEHKQVAAGRKTQRGRAASRLRLPSGGSGS